MFSQVYLSHLSYMVLYMLRPGSDSITVSLDGNDCHNHLWHIDTIKVPVSGANSTFFSRLNKPIFPFYLHSPSKVERNPLSKEPLTNKRWPCHLFTPSSIIPSPHTCHATGKRDCVKQFHYLRGHVTATLCRGSSGNLNQHSPSIWVKERNGSQQTRRGSTETSSHPGLAASLSEDARKLCREQCFSSYKKEVKVPIISSAV